VRALNELIYDVTIVNKYVSSSHSVNKNVKNFVKGLRWVHAGQHTDPSAGAARRIRRRISVRRKSAGKYAARRISRRISSAANPPKNKRAAVIFLLT
jgi:hypothetical protein